LHWKTLDLIQEMNNEIEFITPAHNLLRKIDIGNTARQAHKNRSASLLTSPQAARKKRCTKLDLALLMTSQQVIGTPTLTDREAKNRDLEFSPSDKTRIPGSFGPPVARNKLTYD
jgi:hypothetical protein